MEFYITKMNKLPLYKSTWITQKKSNILWRKKLSCEHILIACIQNLKYKCIIKIWFQDSYIYVMK